MTNVFIPVPGFEEYLVSRSGDFLNRRNRKKLKFSNIKSAPYPRVKLNNKRYNVHRLLAKAFIPNPDNLPFVNHKDGDKYNFNVDNLEWCTNQYNMTHAKENGLLVRGTKVHTNKLDEIQVLTIKSCLGDVSHRKLAKYFSVSQSTINMISSKRNWKHL